MLTVWRIGFAFEILALLSGVGGRLSREFLPISAHSDGSCTTESFDDIPMSHGRDNVRSFNVVIDSGLNS